VSKQKSVVSAQIDALKDIASGLKQVFDVVSAGAKALYMETEQTRNMAFNQGLQSIDQAYRNAKTTGYLPEAADMSTAISSITGGFDESRYATGFEANRDRLVAANQLQALADMADKQLTDAEMQIQTLEKQLETLDAILKVQRETIDVMRGVSEGVFSVSESITALGVAIDLERIARQEEAKQKWEKPYDPDSGFTTGALPGFANGGKHSGGLRMVGERGPELEVTGAAMIYNQQQLGAMLSGNASSSDDGALLAEVRALRADVNRLGDTGNANTGRTANALRTIDNESLVTS